MIIPTHAGRARTASRWLVVLLAFVTALGAGAGCDREAASAEAVVLYTSVDEPVARQIVSEFEKQTGIAVRLVTDTEATKSVGLAERLRAERDRPQADVWWGNEPFHTVALADEGLFKPYESPATAQIAPQFRDDQNRWAGNGLRARVIAVSGQAGAEIARPAVAGIEDLLRPEFRGKIALARPTAGTTGSHVAALYVLWGQDRADAFFRALHDNGVVLVGSNSQVAQQVGAGNYLLGLTDNDDVANALGAGGRLELALPDQGEGGIGTLTIPTTVGLIAGRPDSSAARKLVDFLLSAQGERRLFEAEFAAYSVRADAADRAVKSMQADYGAVARTLPEAVRRATALLEGRDP